jgi:hypothetical protein
MRAPRWLATFTTVAVVGLAACHSSAGRDTVSSTARVPPTAAPVASVVDTGCGANAAAARGKATIPWSNLRNPILSYPATAAKDVGVRLANGRWHLLFSSVTSNPVHWSIGTTSSTDLRHWTPLSTWPDQTGTQGLASPDVVRAPDGSYVVTYQSNPGDVGGAAKLYYRTSRDLTTWSRAKPLARTLHPAPGDRMIDGALAYIGTGVILGFKYGVTDGSQRQAFEIAYSPSGSLAGPWQLVGRPSISEFGDTFENYEFLRIDGRWRIIATTNTLDRPYFASLDGSPSSPSSWLHWSGGRILNIPAEAWNSAPGLSGATHEVANAIYLCDARALDGHYYVFYAGSSELTAFGGWGHAAIGIARSTDLVHWTVP